MVMQQPCSSNQQPEVSSTSASPSPGLLDSYLEIYVLGLSISLQISNHHPLSNYHHPKPEMYNKLPNSPQLLLWCPPNHSPQDRVIFFNTSHVLKTLQDSPVPVEWNHVPTALGGLAHLEPQLWPPSPVSVYSSWSSLSSSVIEKSSRAESFTSA